LFLFVTRLPRFAELREIGNALKGGDSFKISLLSGEQNQFSYKSILKSLWAFFRQDLLSIYAGIRPKSVYYNTESEFIAMKQFKDMLVDAPVVTPYHCVDVQDMKVLVTWATTRRKAVANQFIDECRRRIFPKAMSVCDAQHRRV
jgi:hypothetical protein